MLSKFLLCHTPFALRFSVKVINVITIAIDYNGLSLLLFKEKWTKSRTKQWLVLGFLCPKCDNFACLHIRQDQNELHLKRWFFAKIGIFCKSIAGPLSEALFKRVHNHFRSAEGIVSATYIHNITKIQPNFMKIYKIHIHSILYPLFHQYPRTTHIPHPKLTHFIFYIQFLQIWCAITAALQTFNFFFKTAA